MRTWLTACMTGVLVVGAATLVACSQEPAKKAPQSENLGGPPPLAPGRAGVYEAMGLGPEPFVRALYGLYADGAPTEPKPAAGQEPLYSRMLNATLGADVRVGGRRGPTIDYDLICACDTPTAVTLDSVTITEDGATKADAAVVFTRSEDTVRQTLKLVREGVNWKVDDVIDADGKSVRQDTVKVIEAAGG